MAYVPFYPVPKTMKVLQIEDENYICTMKMSTVDGRYIGVRELFKVYGGVLPINESTMCNRMNGCGIPHTKRVQLGHGSTRPSKSWDASACKKFFEQGRAVYKGPIAFETFKNDVMSFLNGSDENVVDINLRDYDKRNVVLKNPKVFQSSFAAPYLMLHNAPAHFSREMVIKDELLKLTVDGLIPPFTHDTPFRGSASRPDFCWELGSRVVMLEVDERSHSNYNKEREISRKQDLVTRCEQQKLVVIRFNPDLNTFPFVGLSDRITMLSQLLREIFNTQLVLGCNNVEYKLFYPCTHGCDGCKGIHLLT